MGRPAPFESRPESSVKLDLLRSFAVLLVVGFHLAKFFNWRVAAVRVTDFGLLGVMFFFVHTTLVLLFSLERQKAESGGQLFFPFMARRCFRIYPLAILVVTFVYVFRIPSDLQFGSFHLLRQTPANFLANVLLMQNVTRQSANPGVLWSLPLELQMYLVLPALFGFSLRMKSWWIALALWCAVVALWLAAGTITAVLPLSEAGIRSPWEALLKFTRFVPCFLPGVVAYKLWRRPGFLPAATWPVFLGLCCAAFLWISGSQPVETGWFLCLAIGLGVGLFREMPANWLARMAKRIARYSYGIYLLHYFAIWMAFVVCRTLNAWIQIAVFAGVLLCLSAALYHAVEAPMIQAGIRLSRQFRSSSPMAPVGIGGGERSAQALSD
jgi:peptidoglycan/LPS O-acetylase OafA/YrhL